MSKTFELIRPKSFVNEAYLNYEYLIRWIGRDGAEYLYMFYDAEIGNKINNEVINQEDDERIQSLISHIGRSITLTACDLSKNDLLLIGQLLENQYVTRLLKSGEIERYAPDSNSFKYKLMDGRYEIEFELVLSDVKKWM